MFLMRNFLEGIAKIESTCPFVCELSIECIYFGEIRLSASALWRLRHEGVGLSEISDCHQDVFLWSIFSHIFLWESFRKITREIVFDHEYQ